jgi:hypothetical protein
VCSETTKKNTDNNRHLRFQRQPVDNQRRKSSGQILARVDMKRHLESRNP